MDEREAAILLTLAVLIVGIGFFPNALLEYMHASVEPLVAETQRAFAAFSANQAGRPMVASVMRISVPGRGAGEGPRACGTRATP